jgi:hypothetical protein
MTGVTRRQVISTTALSALGAGLMGVAGTTATVTAQPVPSTVPALGTVADMRGLIAASKALDDKMQEADIAITEAHHRLRDMLSPEQYDVLLAHDSAEFHFHMAEMNRLLAEIARHLPGLSPTIFQLGEHILGEGAPTGLCCLPDEVES